MTKKKSTIRILVENYQTVFKLLNYSKGFRKSYFFALFLNAFTMIRFSFIIGFSIQWVTDTAMRGQWEHFRSAMIFAVIAFSLNAVIYFFEGYLMISRVEKMMMQLKMDLYGKVLRLSPTYFDESHSADIQNRISNNLQLASNAVSFTLVDPINFLALGVANLVFIAINSWKMALICCALVILTVLFNSLFIRKIQTLSTQIQDNISSAVERYSDIFHTIPIIRVFSLQDWIFKRYDKENLNVLSGQKKLVKVTSLQQSLNNLINNVCTFVVLGIGAIFLANGEITAGALFAIFRYVNTLVFSFTGIGNVMSQITESVVSADRVLAILDYDEERKSESQQTADENRSSSEVISFDHVSFAYQNGHTVLNNLTFTLKANEKIALVGPSGTGKSTVLNLLMGFYTPTDGGTQIKLYGKPICDYSLQQLRENIGYILQENYLFEGTIRENIAYGKATASFSEIEAAAKAANAHDFIAKLKHGYDTPVGENGSSLSGGEKQRIAIARAILKDAPILLMDEPTSSLDTQTEDAIQKALNELMKNRTVIVVAHRLSTIQSADNIFVLSKGEIIEKGSHQQLLAQDGKYAHDYRLLYSEK